MTETRKPRRQTLEEFLAAHPGDAFARYGVALECVKAGDSEAAMEHFRQLLSAHPDYLYGYFHYGQLLARLARPAEAKKILAAGVAAAERSGDQKALSELSAALAEL